MIKVPVPALGEGIEQAVVSYWHVKEGAQVSGKDDLVELTTDKAAFNVSSPVSGRVIEIAAREGATVRIGDILAVLEEN
jgi:pyruvate/2-oxoglutarate dehydrogenase complex dihydrolipoamide acyltransferase (E2) component